MSQNTFTINRLLQPILLGTIANILINYFFDPDNPDFLWEEFLIAILLSIPLTELNLFFDARLEKKFSWVVSFEKRLMLHLTLLLLSTIFILNVVGNIYILSKGDSFYTWEETITINVISFIVALFLTSFSWLSYYYKRWRIAESDLRQSNSELQKVKSKITEASSTIQLSAGKKNFIVRAENIRQATVRHSTVRVRSKKNEYGIFEGSLTELQRLLPSHLFFLAARNMIIHKDIVRSTSPSSFGKIDVEIDENGDSPVTITISRQKASAFRKWVNSSSATFS